MPLFAGKAPPSLIYQYIQNRRYDDASSMLKTFENHDDIADIYQKRNRKNCIHLIIDQPANDKSKKLLGNIIKVTENLKQIDRFHKSEPFEYALKSKDIGHFDYLLRNRINLLEDKTISNCFHIIVKNNLIKHCKIFLKNLNQKHLKWISTPFGKTTEIPLFKSIEKDCVHIFKIFIKYLMRIKYEQAQIFKQQTDGNTILHIISENRNGIAFFQILLQTKTLFFQSQKTTTKPLLDEMLGYIDDKNKKLETPLFIASKKGNEKMARNLVKYGADFNIPACVNIERNEESILSGSLGYILSFLGPPNVSSKADFISKYILPKNISTNENIIQLLEDAEYGLILEAKNLPKSMIKTIQKRKQKGLLKCCREGRIDYAKTLIQDHKVNPFLVDENQNSLLMIMLNHNVKELIINKFIDFLFEEMNIKFNHLNNDNNNLLILSLEKGMLEVSLHLIKKYHKFLNLDHINLEKNTALTLAIRKGYSNIIAVLSSHSTSIDLNKNGQGWESISLLIKKEREFNEKKTSDLPTLNSLSFLLIS